MSEGGTGFLLGGVGLFLLGMMLMTDGLKTAAGPALSRILASSTGTRVRGLVSGMVVTAMVQSSTAVTIAAIGFVNAGLLGFGESLWLLFGANVGTTMTGWLVALVGLKIKVDAVALPLIGIGMAFHLSGPETRRGAVGGALAGFGILFLGIDFLQRAFSGIGEGVDLAALGGRGIVSVAAFVLAGLLLTVLMQSSSASLAVVLTLAETGVLPLHEAAAAVIGANVGTTVTALLAAIGATPNAKRAASAHVLFNLLTGAVALLLLPVLILGIDLVSEAFGFGSAPAVSLALFHTVFNLLGVLVMWPLADRLTAFLQARFRTREEEAGRPRYLDRNVASVPHLAIDALRREIVRLGGLAIGAAVARVGRLSGQGSAADEAAAEPLSRAIADFATSLSRNSMSESSAAALARLLRVHRYFDTCGDLAPEIDVDRSLIDGLGHPELRAELVGFLEHAGDLLEQLNPGSEPFAPASEHQLQSFEAGYQRLKAGLLGAGARGEIGIAAMESLLGSLSTLRRILDQSAKAARYLSE